MIVNTTKSKPRNLLQRAITKFRGAYKVPTVPRIRSVSPNDVVYDWEKIQASLKLEVINESAYFCMWRIGSTIPVAPTFTYIFDEELINTIIECLEYWVNNFMEKE